MRGPPELATAILSLHPDWEAEGLGSFEYLAGGYSNDNYSFRYHGTRFVLRLPGRPRPFIDRELECAFYRAPGDVLVPEVEAFEPRTGIMITRWQRGTRLCDEVVDPALLVPFVRKLHGSLSPCPRRYDPVALARQQLAIGSPERKIRELADRLEWKPPRVTTCHNDLNPWNIICSEAGDWITLDWEWLGDNDPLFDLVTLHQGLSLDDTLLQDLAEELLGAPQPQRRVGDCLAAFWLREYAWAHAEIEGGNDRPEIHEQLRVSAERLAAQPQPSQGASVGSRR